MSAVLTGLFCILFLLLLLVLIPDRCEARREIARRQAERRGRSLLL